MREGEVVQHSERGGLFIAVLGFSMFSVGDTIIKTIGGAWPGIGVAAIRFSIATVVLGTILAIREGRAGFVMPRPGVQLMRGLGMTLGTAAFFTALFLMPLGESTAIFFVSPMLTTFFATIFLKEPTRKAVWFALALAFAGVLVLVRPNFVHFGWAALLPLIAATGMSMLVLGNRMVAGMASGLAMQFYTAVIATTMLSIFTAFLAVTGIGGMTFGWPDWTVVARAALVAFTASCGHWLVYTATTRAGAAVIAPMAYIQLLVALTFGWLIFGDWPDALSILGAVMIVSAGLFLWWSGKVRPLVEADVP
jgi:drug/metabolite transporter (DMT)-like permease